MCEILDHPSKVSQRPVKHLLFSSDCEPAPNSMKDDIKQPCKDISQFSQHPGMPPIGSHGLIRVEFSQVTPDSTLSAGSYSIPSTLSLITEAWESLLVKTKTKTALGTSAFCVSAITNPPTPLGNSPTFSLFRLFLLM